MWPVKVAQLCSELAMVQFTWNSSTVSAVILKNDNPINTHITAKYTCGQTTQ
jgi:hypothetical protein